MWFSNGDIGVECLRSNTVNTGLFIVRASARARQTMDSAQVVLRMGCQKCPVSDKTEQGAMQQVLKRGTTRYGMLPCDKFTNGDVFWVSAVVKPAPSRCMPTISSIPT